MSQVETLLRRNPHFRSLGDADFDALARAFIVTPHAAGATLMRQGEHGDAVHLVVSGRVDIQRRFGDETVVVRRVEPGEFFGLLAVLHERARTADAVVAEAGEVASLSRTAVQLLLGHSAPIACAFQRALGQQLAHDLRVSSARLRSLLAG